MTTITDTTRTDSDADEKRVPEHHRLIWPLLLIAFLTGYTGLMIRDSYFFADDFLTFGYAHRLGLSWSLFFLSLFGHVAPTERVLHYVPLAISPFNYAVGEGIILALYALLLLSFLWVLRELRLGTVVTLTLVFLAGSSIILLNETLYYDQTVFLLPASTSILCVLALFIRWTRTGRTWALVGAWIVFALSFVTQERPLVVLVYLVLLRYLILPYRGAPGGRRRWVSDWRIWLPFAVVAAAYVSYYLTIAPHTKTTSSSMAAFLRLTGQAFMRLVIGLPVTGTRWTTWVSFAVIAGAFVAVLVGSRRRRLIVRVTIVFIVCFFVNLGPVFHGVGGALGAPGVANSIQYYVDALFALGLSVGIVCSDWVWEGRWSTGTQPGPRHAEARGREAAPLRWVVPACVVIVIVHAALLPFGVARVRQDNNAQVIGRQWMDNLRSSERAINAARSGTVVPLTMPPVFDPGFEAPFDMEADILPLVPGWHDYDSGPVEIIGYNGSVLPTSAGDAAWLTAGDMAGAHLQGLERVAGPAAAACFQGTKGPALLVVALPHVVQGGVLAADVSMTSRRPDSLTPYSVLGSRVSVGTTPVSVEKGPRRTLVPLPATSANAIGLGFSSLHAHFCITSILIGSIRVHAFGDLCQEVDTYGLAHGVTDCGVSWPGLLTGAQPRRR